MKIGFALFLAVGLASLPAHAQVERETFDGEAALAEIATVLAPDHRETTLQGATPEESPCTVILQPEAESGKFTIDMGPLQRVTIELTPRTSFYGTYSSAEGYRFSHFVNDNHEWSVPGQYGDGYRITLQPAGSDQTLIRMKRTRYDDLAFKVIFDASCVIPI